MDYITRDKSIITGKNNLEYLYTFKDAPVFMGCVDSDIKKDLFSNMEWEICKDSGFVQLKKLLPLDILYLDQHNDGIGGVWKDHYLAFVEFIKKNNPQHVLEIGGAHDFIAKHYLNSRSDADWTIVEPNPQHIEDSRIKVIKGWFDNNFRLDTPIDAVVHSHVFEHVYEPFSFMQHVSSFLKVGDKHIFSFPNMLPMLENKFTNCLNFEHTVFLTEYFADYILKKTGFKILDKQYYGNPHSIFYATEKVEASADVKLENKYDEYKKIFNDFINYHLEMVKDLNEKIENSQEQVYLFGAHIFSQYLIQFGLKTNKIINILDNSVLKQEKRLYGTNLLVKSPKILTDKGVVNVILKAGIYDDEIRKDILDNVNNKVNFW
jgi:hypothetical protein